MNILMTSSCSTIVDRKDHVQYLTVPRERSPDGCTYSWTEQKIVINNHNDAMILLHRSKTRNNQLKLP